MSNETAPETAVVEPDDEPREAVVIDPEHAALAVPEPRVEVRRNEDGGRYELSIDDHIAGYSEFKLRDGQIIVTHTETLPSYKGRGVATTLVEAMLPDIRQRGERLVAKCPFVAEYLREHHDFDDIVDG
ncbi:GNAT family N-acetyltransferase [Rathayibacter sp. YIM 133350]|uniref:GNAT family N-acetyltransferase n=1 Tax=Rathayibacter sp. YIM 133350 TaxID=3131992 RepID=UPI00307D1008